MLEGLFLFVAPNGWKRAAEQLQALPDRHLRIVGGVVVAIGVISLWVLRGG
ncbi:hypothetical protein LA76x_3677 [Lysobacter antibioticus]|uniref:Transmembrane protein n=1 Tax=Lysobacter antibioticus TaxID=84531 RepID=A0A0S2FE32_LYSAN|nr:hypothetical protein LA76x_3677 [Lysobacter antibioticus]